MGQGTPLCPWDSAQGVFKRICRPWQGAAGGRGSGCSNTGWSQHQDPLLFLGGHRCNPPGEAREAEAAHPDRWYWAGHGSQAGWGDEHSGALLTPVGASRAMAAAGGPGLCLLPTSHNRAQLPPARAWLKDKRLSLVPPCMGHRVAPAHRWEQPALLCLPQRA